MKTAVKITNVAQNGALSVEIPTGLTGKQLARWKKNAQKEINRLKEGANTEVLESSTKAKTPENIRRKNRIIRFAKIPTNRLINVRLYSEEIAFISENSKSLVAWCNKHNFKKCINNFNQVQYSKNVLGFNYVVILK